MEARLFFTSRDLKCLARSLARARAGAQVSDMLLIRLTRNSSMSEALSVSEADCRLTSPLTVPTLDFVQLHNFLRIRHDSPALALAGFVQVQFLFCCLSLSRELRALRLCNIPA